MCSPPTLGENYDFYQWCKFHIPLPFSKYDCVVHTSRYPNGYHKEPGRCTTNISRILEDYFLQCIKHFDINVLIKMYLKVQGICERLSNLLVKI